MLKPGASRKIDLLSGAGTLCACDGENAFIRRICTVARKAPILPGDRAKYLITVTAAVFWSGVWINYKNIYSSLKNMRCFLKHAPF